LVPTTSDRVLPAALLLPEPLELLELLELLAELLAELLLLLLLLLHAATPMVRVAAATTPVTSTGYLCDIHSSLRAGFDARY
jgi:hypothetical protein